MRPKIVMAGLGETGSVLASMLAGAWDVIAVDPDPEAADRLAGINGGAVGVEIHPGDASSAVVLRQVPQEGLHAAVGCSGSDEVNLEFLRLARDELGINNRFAIMHTLDWEQAYQDVGAEVVSQDRACAAVLASRIQPGQHEATGVGLGQGEIVQVEVLPNSSVIGRRLAELHPKRWLVGAVYRRSKLIVPHGDTVLEPQDQVLLIGDPEILAPIATLIRSGESEFPLQYGSHVVTVCSPGVMQVLDETKYLLGATRADLFEAIACEAEQARFETLVDTCETRGIPHEFSCTAEGTVESLLEEVRRRDVGVLVLPPERLPFLSRIGLGRSRTARIIDLVESPVLITRQTSPYRRILLALAELPFHTAAAQLAIDLARMLDAELHLGVVHQPDIVEGKLHRQQLETRRQELENLAGLYHLKMKTVVVEGNPIHEVERLSRDFDLLVLPYAKGRRSFLTRPDVSLNLIHRAKCSVMVMPY